MLAVDLCRTQTEQNVLYFLLKKYLGKYILCGTFWKFNACEHRHNFHSGIIYMQTFISCSISKNSSCFPGNKYKFYTCVESFSHIHLNFHEMAHKLPCILPSAHERTLTCPMREAALAQVLPGKSTLTCMELLKCMKALTFPRSFGKSGPGTWITWKKPALVLSKCCLSPAESSNHISHLNFP